MKSYALWSMMLGLSLVAYGCGPRAARENLQEERQELQETEQEAQLEMERTREEQAQEIREQQQDVREAEAELQQERAEQQQDALQDPDRDIVPDTSAPQATSPGTPGARNE